MFTFHPYGLLISLGLLAGLAVAWWRKKVYGFNENDLENLFILTVPLGIIGARIYHVLDKWSYYSQNLGQIVAVWNGGLGIYGAVVGGLIGFLIFLKLKPETYNLMAILDFLMPSLAIGQAIGRWGNFFNHEVFGPPTNLPWAWFIPANLRPEMWKNYSFFQPTFAYESLWVLIGFFLLLKIEQNVLFSCLSKKNEPKRKTPSLVASNTMFSRIGKSFGNSPSASSGSVPAFLDTLKKYYYADFTKGTQKSVPTTLRPINKYGILTGFYCIWYGVGRFGFEFLRFDTAEIWGIKAAQIISILLIIVGSWLVFRGNRFAALFRTPFGLRERKSQ